MRCRLAPRALAVFAPVALVLALGLATRTAEASVVEPNAATITAVALGTAGGVTTSIAAIVYAADGRAFDDAWVTASLFTSAICGAMAVAVAIGAPSGQGAFPIVGVLFYGTLSAWPLYWTVKGAIADVDPGDRFQDPSLALERREDAARSTSATAVNVPLLAFAF